MNYQIEVTRNNVTLAQFLTACRAECKKRNIGFEIDRQEFENPTNECNTHYYVKDNKKIGYNGDHRTEWDAEDAPCKAETFKTLPLGYQCYALYLDGSSFNEICEFAYWDDKKGTGYYYQANKDN